MPFIKYLQSVTVFCLDNTLPKGSVYAVKRGERRYYYHQIYTEKGRIQKYVRLSQVEELKKSIGIRRGLEEQLRNLKKEIKLLHSILKRLKIDAKQVYREGLQKVWDMHQKWAEKEKRRRESRRDAYGFDNKINVTEKGEYVRSKSEMLIANMLTHFDIDYEYEKELYFGKKKVLPDFTIHFGDRTYYWEHCGMMDNPEYLEKWEEKRRIYEENGIHEGKNLILSYEYGEGLDSERVRNLIRTFFA